jgi:cytochrome oxidase Cu insertion factor (SCO1/SenC/PrrC family)
VRALLALVALVLAPLTWFWTLDQPFLRSSGLSAWLLLAVALGLALSAAWRDRRKWVRGVAALALGAVAFFTWAFFVFARMPATHLPARAPDFTLPDQDGRPVTLAAELQRGPVLLVFFRGHW